MNNNNNDLRPWTLKYTTRCFDDLCGHQTQVDLMKRSIRDQKGLLKNFIFYGPCGSGKTSLMNCCIEEIFGEKSMGRDCTRDTNFVLRTNASEERCLDNVKTKLKTFAEYRSSESARLKVKRIVALDEVDSMKEDAQTALHSLISEYSDTVCFMMTCNDLTNNLIQPLCSKCTTIHVGSVGVDDMALMVLKIAERENISCTKQGISALLLAAHGDVRHMLNDFQAASAAYDGKLTEEAVLAINHAPSRIHVLRVLEQCLKKSLKSALKLSRHLVEKIGYDVSDILTTMYHCVISERVFLDGDPRVLLKFQDILKQVMITAAKQKATVRTLHGVIARMCL